MNDDKRNIMSDSAYEKYSKRRKYMSVYCIADFHLSNDADKPMHKFGAHWLEHDQKLRENLLGVLKEDDTLLIPGDISWAIDWQSAAKDMLFIHALPGRKILLRGNHDYWWGTLKKNYRNLEELGINSIDFLQNNAFRIEDAQIGNFVLAGTRGWIFPTDPKWQQADRKIYEREIHRLQISLWAAEKIRKSGDRLLIMTHFPPINTQLAISPFTKLMREYRAELCCYGHIHHTSSPYQLFGQKIDQVKMYLCACDQIDFRALKIDDCLE